MVDTTGTAGSGGPRGVAVGPVTEWMAERTTIAPPLGFELIAGGHSNLTFRVSDASGSAWVLRRPPLFQVLESAHDMGREHRVIHALQDSAVPVPGLVGFCEDESVNERPFYVMDFVPGTVFRSAEMATEFGSDRLPAVTKSLIETLAAIHAVDVDAVGLGQLGRKENYIARQLRRWLGQFEASKTRERPELVAVHDHLVARIPDQGTAGLVHGDYRLDNCLVAEDATIAAVLDWELCTLGDVLADVASLLTYWARPVDGFTPIDAAPTMADGFPEREQLLTWYQEASGRSMDDIDFYLSFSSWRLASILEGVYSRYVSGAMGDAEPEGGAEAFVERIDALVAQSAEYAGRVA
ncbi:MAG: phosphotransferase family protein [Actinomycetota bacterium]